MSQWYMWCIDMEGGRISDPADDIFISDWEWTEMGDLKPVCEFRPQSIIVDGPVDLYGWRLARAEDWKRSFTVRVQVNVMVDRFASVACTGIDIPAEMVELIEEYLSTRPGL